ncbi:MAG: sensor domain-containing protein, partial [Candidatus Limnocylindrales bacterium]
MGLLLILAGLVSARIPGEATFASSGISLAAEGEDDARTGPLSLARRVRNPARAFVLSPIHPQTWYANTAIGAGFFVGIFTFAMLASFASAGFATIVAGVGVIVIALGIEAARLVARFERRRVMLGAPDHLLAHPYRSRSGGLVELLKAEFADENRWRDVLYVAVNFPLSIIEFLVVATIWALSLWLLTMPIWYDAVAGATLPDYLGAIAGRDASAILIRTLAGAALLPVAASVSQLVLSLHRGVVMAPLGTSESRELRRQVETLKESRSAVLDVEA